MRTEKKTMLLSILAMTLICLFFTLHPTESTAQQPQQLADVREDFSDKELKSFIKASKKVSLIQKQRDKKVVNAIEKEGLSVERFNEILEAQKNPEKKTDASAEELTSFNTAAQIIMSEDQMIEKKKAKAVEQTGIDMDTYKEIMFSYRQSPKIQEKIGDLLTNDN